MHNTTLSPTRRGLLLAGLGMTGLGAFGGLPGALQLAQGAGPEFTDRYFVFCYFSGGWDILLSLDPRDPAVFRDDLVQETRIQPGYSQLDVPGYPNPTLLDTAVAGMQLGPFARPLVPWANQLAVVRGISMETLTHEVGRRRFITGKAPSGLLARGSSISTHIASHLGNDSPIPNLSAQVESYNVDRPTWASALKVDDVDDLVRALAPGATPQSEDARSRIDALLAEFGDCEETRKSVLRSNALQSRRAAHELVNQGLDQQFAFDAATPEMEALRDRYGFSGDTSSPEAHAAMAATALLAGISRCISITPGRGLDTHYSNWEDTQGPLQERGFAAIANLAADLQSREYRGTGESWLDRTVIVGFSEFCRTPALNSDGGRDHSLTNACFLLGGGIKGGQVIGASSDVGMEPTPTNLKTGQPDRGGEIVSPEHIHRALLVHAGLTEDVADLRVEPLAALFS